MHGDPWSIVRRVTASIGGRRAHRPPADGPRFGGRRCRHSSSKSPSSPGRRSGDEHFFAPRLCARRRATHRALALVRESREARRKAAGLGSSEPHADRARHRRVGVFLRRPVRQQAGSPERFEAAVEVAASFAVAHADRAAQLYAVTTSRGASVTTACRWRDGTCSWMRSRRRAQWRRSTRRRRRWHRSSGGRIAACVMLITGTPARDVVGAMRTVAAITSSLTIVRVASGAARAAAGFYACSTSSAPRIWWQRSDSRTAARGRPSRARRSRDLCRRGHDVGDGLVRASCVAGAALRRVRSLAARRMSGMAIGVVGAFVLGLGGAREHLDRHGQRARRPLDSLRSRVDGDRRRPRTLALARALSRRSRRSWWSRRSHLGAAGEVRIVAVAAAVCAALTLGWIERSRRNWTAPPRRGIALVLLVAARRHGRYRSRTSAGARRIRGTLRWSHKAGSTRDQARVGPTRSARTPTQRHETPGHERRRGHATEASDTSPDSKPAAKPATRVPSLAPVRQHCVTADLVLRGRGDRAGRARPRRVDRGAPALHAIGMAAGAAPAGGRRACRTRSLVRGHGRECA